MSVESPFARTSSGEIAVQLDDVERELLASIARQVHDFVAPPERDRDADPLELLVGIDDDAEPSDDPALLRLFPDAFTDDPASAAEFRRFTERGLRDAKATNAQRVVEVLESGVDRFPVDSAGTWLGLLNDARLAIGTRIEITEDNHAELASLPEDDPRLTLFNVYDWLTYLQETLVQLVL